MRFFFNDMLEICPLPNLYGISALGATLRVYKGDTATFEMQPPTDLSAKEFFTPRHYLENEWSLELMSQEGFDEMKSIATDISSARAPCSAISSSFENATMWPPQLLAAFAAEREGSQHESRYYAPYNKLLNWMFPSWDYSVVPHAVTGIHSENIIYSIALFVMSRGKLVMLLDMKDDGWIARGSTRDRAEVQIRHLFYDNFNSCSLPILYGISALGTTLRVYKGNPATYEIQPPGRWLALPGTVLPPHFLENQWSVELLSQEGFDEMKKIAAYILSAS
ncbi:hypothetical protein BDZ89DRAFT_1155968 [Hymenopellis radicata]|nr:hypothetical protein BDZ89DRAFT_1155968 [Hymenopellis radicata]